MIGADDRDRTDDILVGGQTLFQLSYIRETVANRTGLEPAIPALKGQCLNQPDSRFKKLSITKVKRNNHYSYS